MAKEKHVTLEGLAVMVQRGFTDMHERFVAKDDFKILVDEIRLLREDFRDVKGTIRSLASVTGTHDRDIRRLKENAGLDTD